MKQDNSIKVTYEDGRVREFEKGIALGFKGEDVGVSYLNLNLFEAIELFLTFYQDIEERVFSIGGTELFDELQEGQDRVVVFWQIIQTLLDDGMIF